MKCNHEWKIYNDVGINASIPSVCKCQKCATIMTASEVFQLEALENQNESLKHLKGFQKYISIIAIVVSFMAMLVSIWRK